MSLPVRPLPDGSDIRKVAASEIPQVAAALARAFHDDPVFAWVIPDDSSRLRRLERSFELWARRIWIAHDECYTTDRHIGGAMWLPPGKWHVGLPAQLRLVPGTIAALGARMPRFVRFVNALQAKHPRERHYYLPVVGIEPEWQGRGFGAAIMRPVLDRCDDERVPAYLEASSARSRALYERLGFEVVEELTVGGSPPVWRMWRTPRARQV